MESNDINIMVEYYNDDSSVRQQELITSLVNNVANTLIKNIHLFGLADDLTQCPIKDDKIIHVPRATRSTFNSYFSYANEFLSNQICIIANSDIYFDATLEHLKTIDFNKYALALCRWDVNSSGKSIFFNRSDSFDSWVFKSPLNVADCDFFLGLLGCDNRIAYQIQHAGRQVINPSKSIITHHLHASGKRNYGPHSRLHGYYIGVGPTTLEKAYAAKPSTPVIGGTQLLLPENDAFDHIDEF